MPKFSENESPWLTFVQQQAAPGAPAAGLFRFFLNAANTFGLIDSAGNTYTLGAAGTNGTDGIDGLPGVDGTNGINGVGVPTGGTTGQALVKKSATDYDTEWGVAGIGDAPTDGNTYARQNGAWEEVAGGSGLSGGLAGQVLQKYDNGNGDYGWRTIDTSGAGGSGGGIFNLSPGVPALSAFTQMDPTPCTTFAENPGKALGMKITSAHPNSPNIVGMTKAAPAAPYSLAILCLYSAPQVPYNGVAYGWYDPSTGKYDVCVFEQDNYNEGQTFESQNYTSPTDRVNCGTVGTNPVIRGLFWLHLTDDGTNIKWGYSIDGISIVPMYSYVKANGYLAGLYTNVFIGIFSDGEAGNSFLGSGLNILCWDENGANRGITSIGGGADVTSQKIPGLMQYNNFCNATDNTLVPDLVGNNTCLLYNGPVLDTDGILTDGATNYIDTGAGLIGLCMWTAAVRFQTTNANPAGGSYYDNPTIWGIALGSEGGDGALTMVNGALEWWWSWIGNTDANGTTTAPAINDGNWHTLVVTSNRISGTIIVYCDGVAVQTSNGTVQPYGKILSGLAQIFGNGPFLGAANGNDYTNPIVSDTAIAAKYSHYATWALPLTAAQVAALDLTALL